jgi:hypothetical protein
MNKFPIRIVDDEPVKPEISDEHRLYDEHHKLTQMIATFDQASQTLFELKFTSNQRSIDPLSMTGLLKQMRVIKQRLSAIENLICIHTKEYKSFGNGEGVFECTKCGDQTCFG